MPLPSSQRDCLSHAAKTVLDPWLEQHKNFPEVLFHYTSAEGLLGIVGSQSIWMTDLRYMNDSSELEYARALAKDRIESRLIDQDLSEVQAEFLRRAASMVDQYDVAATFSASFCEDGNLLSQWRAYRGQGGGYAIGIDFFHTQRFLSRKCSLRKVQYNRPEQIQLLDKLIDSFLDSIAAVTPNQTVEDAKDFLPEASGAFSDALAQLVHTIKHPDFREEREWRLAYFAIVDPRFQRGSEPPSFRAYSGNLIPYYSVSFNAAVSASKDDASGVPFPIREVVVGPTLAGSINKRSIRTLLLSQNPDFEPEIIVSETPLRWM